MLYTGVRELREKHKSENCHFLEVKFSYDGAYQKRRGKSGGGISGNCFASAISVES